ncbi:glutathione transferase GstA [Caenimonas aquaedulcis]|uniref:Glutathione transferase GstA n=1 Tax=Caenimonas aquaedulcis TaxID=2793270 RepID=A0A931H651_9BURK|nr:glutathione transferase GstA [Caenimonas aquaedulcis]MBG9389248.1 glutathione transferase GstA [Caenimonas aquaedulcis]
MKLYFAPSACSQAVHIALREAGLTPELAQVDLTTHRLADGSDYHAINPRGYVPLLELDDGSRHTEVAALLQYIGDLVPAKGLMPPVGARARLGVNEWLTFVSSELHKVFSPWLWHKDTAESTRKACKDKIALRFAELDEVLGQRDYIAGDHFTVADAYGFTIVSWAPMLGMSLQPYPRLQAWLARIAARPAVRAALDAERPVKS